MSSILSVRRGRPEYTMFRLPAVLQGALLLVASCAPTLETRPAEQDGGPIWTDAGVPCPDPEGDLDGDRIPNQVEGCRSDRDTDGDRIPDWQDSDSDGDKVPDHVEGGDRDTDGYSHDLYESVQETALDLYLHSASDVSSVRNEVLARMLGRPPGDLGNKPQAYGGAASSMVLRFTTVRRVELKRHSSGKVLRDAQGKPLDTGDRTKRRLLVIGAVASQTEYEDPRRKTGLTADDLANGTALAHADTRSQNECDVHTVTRLPVADIIWVKDESGSMSDSRQDIVNNADVFFKQALASGLDFRLGVTNVCNPFGSYAAAVGKFCSRISPSNTDMGGTDRFLLPAERLIFASCIRNPPGYEGGIEYGLVNAAAAVLRHLPRDKSNPARIRPGAQLSIIVVTDEAPYSLLTLLAEKYNDCTLDAATRGRLDAAVKPYLDLFSGTLAPEARATMHAMAGVCHNSCGAIVAHGYREVVRATGGELADICQKNLSRSIQVIIGDIIADASPVVLARTPISASLALAVDGAAVPHGRSAGFDYNASNNSLVLVNVKYQKGSEVVAGYSAWELDGRRGAR